MSYISGFYGRLETMSRIVSAVQRAAAATQRVFGILDRQATVPEPLHPVHPGRLARPDRIPRRRLPLRQSHGRRGDQPGHPAGRDDRPGRPQRGGQDHAGQPGLPLLRRGRRRRADRRHRRSRVSHRGISPEHRAGPPGAVLCFTARLRRTSPTAGPTPDARRSSPPPGPPAPTNSSSACPTVTIRWSANAAKHSPAANGSGSASPGRS